MKTIKLQAICDSNLDMYKWLCDIGLGIRFQDLMVWISFSYMSRGKLSDEGVERQYIWAAQELSLEKTKLYQKVIFLKLPQLILSQSEWDDFCRRFKNRSFGTILQDIGQAHVSPFGDSGFNPYKLVMAYIWIR